MCILIRLLPLSIVTHSNSPSACLVMFGCSKNIVQIIEIMIFRFNVPNTLGLINQRTSHINVNIAIKINGMNMVKNAFSISFEGANNFISESSANQSNDKNTSDDAPNISIGPKTSSRVLGNFKLNEWAAVINCK